MSLFLSNNSTDSDQQPYLCSTTNPLRVGFSILELEGTGKGFRLVASIVIDKLLQKRIEVIARLGIGTAFGIVIEINGGIDSCSVLSSGNLAIGILIEGITARWAIQYLIIVVEFVTTVSDCGAHFRGGIPLGEIIGTDYG